LQGELLEYLAGDRQWWRPWLQTLRRDPVLLAKWYEHRQRGLTESLIQALAEAGLAGDVGKAAYDAILSSRRRRPAFERGGSQTASMTPSHENQGVERPTGDLLRIVQYIAVRMSERELRSLLIPLGLTLDALEHFKASR
jgi:hypothetical protein